MHTRALLRALLAIALALATLTIGGAKSSAQPAVDPDDPFGSDSAAMAVERPLGNARFDDYYGAASIPADDASDIDIDPATGWMWRTRTATKVADVIHLDGTPIATIGTRGSGPGQLDTPTSISVSGGEVFISDWANERIAVFTTLGQRFVRNIDNRGDGPCGNAIVGDRLVVTSFESRRIRLFDTDTGALISDVDGSDSGKRYGEWSCNGNNVAIHRGEIYIADSPNGRIMVFDSALNWQRDIDVAQPGGIDIAADRIWVTNKFNDSIRQFTLAGVRLDLLNESGGALGEINFPLGIEVDPSGASFWVADDNNLRVQAFTSLRCMNEQLTLVGSSAADLLRGTDGNDVIHGAGGHDRVDGGAGADHICGGAGDDILDGADGDDELAGGRGRDTVHGSMGDDRAFGGKGDDTMTGGEGDDVMFGDSGSDELWGGPGNDAVYGYAQADYVSGGPGDDFLFGNSGDDVIDGGAGNDAISGHRGDDRIDGMSGDDTADGGGGDDTILGGTGNDVLNGSRGADHLEGNSGDDTLRGGAGADVLDGGADTDFCNGQANADVAARCEELVDIP